MKDTDTHILVSRKAYDEIKDSNQMFDTIEFLDECPSIDLSEANSNKIAKEIVKEDDEGGAETSSYYIYSRDAVPYFLKRFVSKLLKQASHEQTILY